MLCDACAVVGAIVRRWSGDRLRGDVMSDAPQVPVPSGEWRVDIETHGRSGAIHYREQAGSIRFDWEFGSGDVVAIVSGPEPDAWDSLHPWAAGRRTAITTRVADEVVRQKAPTCIPDIDEHSGIVHLVPA